jgi:hypothetical protein
MTKPHESGRVSGRVEPRGASAQVGGGATVGKTNEWTGLPSSHSIGRPRITVARLAQLTDHLDDRDLTLLATVRRLRVASHNQLQRLHFGNDDSAARQARRVLSRLVEVDVLARLERRVGGRRAGSAGFVYALGLAGQRLAGGRGPAGGQRVEEAWTPSRSYLKHALAVSELYCQLQAAAVAGRFDLLDFEGEPSCWRRFIGSGGSVVTLKPDCFVRLAVGDLERLAFVEVDCATESPRALDRKLERYRDYVRSGAEAERWGVVPLVLWLVPDERRASVIVEACSRQPAILWKLYQVATFGRAVDVLSGATS